MHFLVVVQDALPTEDLTGVIGEFIKKISSKQYNVPFVTETWAKIRPREIRFFDFTIPESIEEEVLEDLAPYAGGKLTKLNKIAKIPILKGILENALGIKPVEMDNYITKIQTPETRVAGDSPIYLTIIGKVGDGHMEDGRELL